MSTNHNDCHTTNAYIFLYHMGTYSYITWVHILISHG